MSQENVEVVRRNYAALVEGLEGGDFETGGSDAFFAWLDPEIDWRGPREFPDLAEPRVGPEGVREYVRVLFEAIEDYRMVPEEFIDVGDDRVLVFSREGGRGRGSGAEVITQPTAHLWTIRNGRAVGMQSYWERSEALEAAGLSESAMSQENIEIVRNYVKVWNGGDMEGVRELYDPDAVMEVAPDWPEPGPFVGRDAVMEQLSQARAAFDNDWGEIVGEPLAAGDRVIVRLNWHGTGRGPQSDMEWTLIFSIRNGRIFGVEYFWHYPDALEAAGLSE